MLDTIPELRPKRNEIELRLPRATEAEGMLIGAILMAEGAARDRLATVRRAIAEQDFSHSGYRAIFKALCDLADADRPINPSWLEFQLREQGKLTTALQTDICATMGGVAYSSDLSSEIRAIRAAADRREIIKVAESWQTSAQDPTKDVHEVISQIRERAAQIGRGASDSVRIGKTWEEMAVTEYPPIEAIVHATPRGRLLMCAALTNVGKTTFWRNASICLAAGRSYAPLVSAGPPRKVMYLDFEWPEAGVKKEIMTMLGRLSRDERAAVARNLCIVADDVEIDGQAVNLSNPRHLRVIEDRARDFGADIIVIDTMTAAFTLQNENDNAEAAHVCKIMRGLARRLKCVVVFLHHVGKGKSEAGQTSEAAHRARGGSGYSGFAPTVINLLPDGGVPGRIIVEDGKRKGVGFESFVMTLNQDERWFDAIGAASVPVDPYRAMLGKFNGAPLRRAEIAEKTGLPKNTLTDYLARAVEKGDLQKIAQGTYQKPHKTPNTEIPNPIGAGISVFGAETAQTVEKAEDREEAEV